MSTMPNVLEGILASTRLELERRKAEMSEAELRSRALAAPQPERTFRAALAGGPEIAIVAEFKRRSPSAGRLRERADVAAIVRAYERGGASAISVLTEGPNFEGSLRDLGAAREACGLPLLRKDFVVDPYQLYEARLAGAAAVLLIVAALEAAELEALGAQARALGLDVLVEVHDAAELDVALAADAELIGINNRDLRDFSVDLERTFALLREVPAGVPVVSESGIASPEQLVRLREAGAAAVLVGESLMRAEDPEQALRAFSAYSAQAVARRA
ncbi:MAG TPA: indole-3-glycerol phosphate synthase TrpC [Solirubrobacteraceae bacterium]|nr:indole-3-glycerol phosphate synthase TrpC [Solirubrobacteraceae bacterium]